MRLFSIELYFFLPKFLELIFYEWNKEGGELIFFCLDDDLWEH